MPRKLVDNGVICSLNRPRLAFSRSVTEDITGASSRFGTNPRWNTQRCPPDLPSNCSSLQYHPSTGVGMSDYTFNRGRIALYPPPCSLLTPSSGAPSRSQTARTPREWKRRQGGKPRLIQPKSPNDRTRGTLAIPRDLDCTHSNC